MKLCVSGLFPLGSQGEEDHFRVFIQASAVADVLPDGHPGSVGRQQAAQENVVGVAGARHRGKQQEKATRQRQPANSSWGVPSPHSSTQAELLGSIQFTIFLVAEQR